jgi:aryl-alcohol dehydrogenase-like predicted oxidoreductase
MNFRPLGRSGLRLAPLMLGTNVFGWYVEEKTAHAILDAFVDGGFNAIDTADSYSRWVPGHPGGESETVIGTWLKRSGKRDKVVIATKVGESMGDFSGNRRNLTKDYILRAAEGSLKRLQTDRIDLYQTHFDDEATPAEETLSAYAELIAQGKVRAIGASNMTPERLKASLAASKRLGIPRYESLQPLYNLSDRKEFESEYAPICRAEGIGVINYYSLAAGFLSGKYRTADDAAKNPARGGRVRRYLDARGLRILKAVDDVAARHQATHKPSLAQIALAWLIAQPLVTAPIASATSVAQLQELMKAPQIKLSSEDLAALNTAGD